MFEHDGHLYVKNENPKKSFRQTARFYGRMLEMVGSVLKNCSFTRVNGLEKVSDTRKAKGKDLADS